MGGSTCQPTLYSAEGFFFFYICSYKVEDCILSIGFNSDVFPNTLTRHLPRVADLGSSKMWGEISFLVNNLVYFKAYIESVKQKLEK